MSSVIPNSSSAPATASTLITSSGIGSGLNIGAIVSSLTGAYGAAQTNQLTNQQTLLDSQVSAYGTFAAALDTLKLAVPALQDPKQLAGFTAAVADKTIATATTSPSPGAGQYSLLVNNFATSATLTSPPAPGAAAGGR